MEAAWEDAKGEASALDPDLEAVWQQQDDEGGLETLDSVWDRTSARLEGGGAKETPYELNSENRFSELSDPFEKGVRLFEEGQIADAALCFEAEIARNPENSQVCYCLWVGIYSLCSICFVEVWEVCALSLGFGVWVELVIIRTN